MWRMINSILTDQNKPILLTKGKENEGTIKVEEQNSNKTRAYIGLIYTK